MAEKPDLSESAWTRARLEARSHILNTLLGLLTLAAFGGAGGEWASRADLGPTGLEVAFMTLGGLVGALVGIAVFAGVQLALAARKQRDELRGYVTDQDERAAEIAQFKSVCLEWAADVEKFLQVQEAKEPPQPARVRLADRLKGVLPHPTNTPRTERRYSAKP